MSRRTYKPRRVWRRAFVCLTLLGLLGVGAALAEDRWVSGARVQLLEGKGSVYGTVAEAPHGAKLVVKETDGKWLLVEYNGKEGWVHENALSTKDLSNELTLGGSGSSGVDTSAAAKGLLSDDYAKARGYDKTGVVWIENQRKLLDQKENKNKWKDFVEEGNLTFPAGK
jgi:uncharacterized protein YraI